MPLLLLKGLNHVDGAPGMPRVLVWALKQNREMPPITEIQDIPLQAYVRSRQLELATSLESKKAVYLDIKFWIILRDVVTGVREGAAEQKLLSLLREAVRRSLIFCPISDSTFTELLKKVDLRSRQVTADLIDELSLGITLIPYDLRAGTELAHFLHSARSPNAIYPLEHLVWTKLAYVMGFIYPRGTSLRPAQELAVQKMFFDHMWTISMREMVDRIGDHALPDPQRFEALARTLNQLNVRHSEELRTFAQTYDNEVHGILDAFMNVSIDILEQMMGMDFGEEHPLSSEQREEERKQLHNLLFAAFKTDATKQALRTLHILATLHAAIRWNRQQRLKANDFLDFQHATAALGYCDAFFTERSLRSLVTASHIALDQRHGCHVGASVEDAVSYLQRLMDLPRKETEALV